MKILNVRSVEIPRFTYRIDSFVSSVREATDPYFDERFGNFLPGDPSDVELYGSATISIDSKRAIVCQFDEDDLWDHRDDVKGYMCSVMNDACLNLDSDVDAECDFETFCTLVDYELDGKCEWDFLPDVAEVFGE